VADLRDRFGETLLQDAESISPILNFIGLHEAYAMETRGNRIMTAAESRALKKGTRVYWHGNVADSGIISATSWDAVTIAWDNGHIATVHHGDMGQIDRAPTEHPPGRALP
jgi:hypothetical protein